MSPMERSRSTRGNDWLKERLSHPERANEVSKIRAGMAEEDRVYAMNLATVRKAGQLTQEELAKRLGVGQDAVSRTEHREDMLLSTLRNYLHAAGAVDVAITMTVGGRRVELDIDAP